MGLDIENVHIMKRSEGTNQLVITGKNPYTRFVQSGEFPISVQRGKFYTDAGDPMPVDSLPGWVKKQVDRMTPDARAAVGLPREGMIWKPVKQEEPSKIEPEPEDMEPPPRGASELTIQEAVQQMDPLDDSMWTREGKPQLKEIIRLTGKYVTRYQVDTQTQWYKRPEA